MKLTQKQFDRAMTYVHQGRSTAEVAALCNVSERVVQRVREAGSWERWPYIVAKTTHGYGTPEYRLYLKRRGLPLTPPSKMRAAPRVRKQPAVLNHKALTWRERLMRKIGLK